MLLLNESYGPEKRPPDDGGNISPMLPAFVRADVLFRRQLCSVTRPAPAENGGSQRLLLWASFKPAQF